MRRQLRHLGCSSMRSLVVGGWEWKVEGQQLVMPTPFQCQRFWPLFRAKSVLRSCESWRRKPHCSFKKALCVLAGHWTLQLLYVLTASASASKAPRPSVPTQMSCDAGRLQFSSRCSCTLGKHLLRLSGHEEAEAEAAAVAEAEARAASKKTID